MDYLIKKCKDQRGKKRGVAIFEKVKIKLFSNISASFWIEHRFISVEKYYHELKDSMNDKEKEIDKWVVSQIKAGKKKNYMIDVLKSDFIKRAKEFLIEDKKLVEKIENEELKEIGIEEHEKLKNILTDIIENDDEYWREKALYLNLQKIISSVYNPYYFG